MMHSQDDVILLEQLKAGNSAAFVELYNKYKYLVQGISYYTLGNSAEAEDVLQETFKDFWRNRHKITIKSSFKNYLITVAKNKSLNIIKTRSHHNKYIQSTNQQDAIQAPSKRLENNDIRKEINTALNNVNSVIIREAFTLIYMEGLNYEETARQLGITVPTSRNYVSKAVKQLRGFLKNSQ